MSRRPDTYGPCEVCGLTANWRTRHRPCVCGDRHLVCRLCAAGWGLGDGGAWATCPDAVRTAREVAGLRTAVGHDEWNPPVSRRVTDAQLSHERSDLLRELRSL